MLTKVEGDKRWNTLDRKVIYQGNIPSGAESVGKKNKQEAIH